jgi:hypothetical protein
MPTFSTTISPTAQSSENGDCEIVIRFATSGVVDPSTHSLIVRVKDVSDKGSSSQDTTFLISKILSDHADEAKTTATLPITLQSLGSTYVVTVHELNKNQYKTPIGTTTYSSNTHPDPAVVSIESTGSHTSTTTNGVTGVNSNGIRARVTFGKASGGSDLANARVIVYYTSSTDSSSKSQQNVSPYVISAEELIEGSCVVEVDQIVGAAPDSIHMVIVEVENSNGWDSKPSNTATVSNSVRTPIPNAPITSIKSGGNKSAVLRFSEDVLPSSTYNFSSASGKKLHVLIREAGTASWSTSDVINKNIEVNSSLDATITKINGVDLTAYKTYEVTVVASDSILLPSSNVPVTIATGKPASQSSISISSKTVLKFVPFEYSTVDAAITSSTFALAVAPAKGLVASALTATPPVWNAPSGSSLLYFLGVEGSKDGSTFSQLKKPTLTNSITGNSVPLSNLTVSGDDLSNYKSFTVALQSVYKLSATVAAFCKELKELGAALPDNVYTDADSKIIYQMIGAKAFGRQFAEPLSTADLPKPTLQPYMIGSSATRNIMMQLGVSQSELASRNLTPYSVSYQVVKAGNDFQESKLLFLKDNVSSPGDAVTTLEILANNNDLADFQLLHIMTGATGSTKADLDDKTVYSVRAKLSYLQSDIQNVNVGDFCDSVTFTTEEGLPTFSAHNAIASVDDSEDNPIGKVLVNLTFPDAAPAGYAYIPAGLGVSTLYGPNGDVMDSYTYVSSSTSAAFPFLADRIKNYTFNILTGLIYGKAYTVVSSINYKSTTNSKIYVSSLSKSTVTFVEPSTVVSIIVTTPPHSPANSVTSLTTKAIDKFKVAVAVNNPDNVSFVKVHVNNMGTFDQVATRVPGTNVFKTVELTKIAQDYKNAPVVAYVQSLVGKNHVSYLLLG